MRPEDRRARPTLVVLHGHDDDDTTTRRWAERLVPVGWRIEIPVAPGGAGEPRSWFETGPRGVDPAEVERSTAVIARVVVAAAGAGPVVLAGFSQGAAMALAVGGLPGVIGVVGICPFLPEVDGTDLSEGPPALLLAAADDEVVPQSFGEDAAATLAQAGRAVTLETFPGPHGVGDEVAARVRRWLEDRFPTRPRVSLGLPVDRVESGAELVSGDAIATLAGLWEDLGFDAAHVTDHPAPDDRWLAAGGHHSLEPTVALATAASATSTLLLHTHVYVLGYRNVFLAAKALATLDLVSGGRLVLGVAAGYLRPEFDALGADFEHRGEELDATLELLPRIWSGDPVTADGRGFSARSVAARPGPLQQPHMPIWVGGNSRRAMRRAVRHGQGWSPFPTPDGLERATRTAPIAHREDLVSRLAELDDICGAEGRAERPTVCFSPFGLGGYLEDPDAALGSLVEEIAALWEVGVDWFALSVPGSGRAEVSDRAARLAAALGLPAQQR